MPWAFLHLPEDDSTYLHLSIGYEIKAFFESFFFTKQVWVDI